jgi:hypothetical protein
VRSRSRDTESIPRSSRRFDGEAPSSLCGGRSYTFLTTRFLAFKLLNTNGIERDVRIAIACAIISDDRSQVLDSKDGEMSEWLKEHAWKAKRARNTEGGAEISKRMPSTNWLPGHVAQSDSVRLHIPGGFQAHV